MAASTNIWYVHPYAGGPGIGRYSRPFFLSRHWLATGAQATVFTASNHHLLDEPQQAGAKVVEGVPYEFVKVGAYTGNGLGRLRNMAEFSWRFARQATAYAEQYGKPDAIIASSPHPYAFLATDRVATRMGARSVFEVRDLWPLSLVELAGVSPSHPLVRFTGWVERQAYRRADCVVSLLPNTLEHMTAHGLDAGRWAHVPNGVDVVGEALTSSPESAHPCVQQVRDWSQQGLMTVAYTGALGRPNHVGSLIHAVSRLKAEGLRHVRALVVGRGEQEHELRQLIKSLALEDEIQLHGQIPKAAVIDLLGFASAGYISLRPEPLFRFGVSPNKLFDYMLAGLPVVFAVDAGNDPVSSARCGFTAHPDDPEAVAGALRQMARTTSSERLEMGARGRDYVLQHHSYGRLAETYLDLLRA